MYGDHCLGEGNMPAGGTKFPCTKFRVYSQLRNRGVQQTPHEKASQEELQLFWCFCATHRTSLTCQRGKFTGPLIHTDLSLCAVYVIVDHRLDLNPLLDPHNDTEDVIWSACLAVCASPSSVCLCREQKCGKIWGVEWRQLRVQKKPVLAKWLVCELI